MYECPNQNEQCRVRYDFEKNAIFVWSKDTLIADEIFHSYFACRGKREIHFSSFVNEMTLGYTDLCENSAPFISVGLFTSCVMSWIINQNIDYRSKDAICPFCGHNPEVLACDGVKVGVNLKYLTHLQRISAAEKNEIKPYLHRRNDRILVSGEGKRIPYLRKFLLEYCRNVIRLGKDNPVIPTELQRSDEETKEPIMNCEMTQHELLQEMEDYRCTKVLKALFEQEYHIELAKTVANFIICLNGMASLINFFPTKNIPKLSEAFEYLKDPLLCESKQYELLKKIKEFKPQFSSIMKTAFRHGKGAEIADFFLYLIEKTTNIHAHDANVKPDEPEIVDQYDPTKGVSYNFTEHGAQIRKLPKYAMDGNVKNTKVYV